MNKSLAAARMALFSLLLVIGGQSTDALAKIWLEVSDGTTTHPTPPVAPFSVYLYSPKTDLISTMSFFIFDAVKGPCKARPCMFYFPSGIDASGGAAPGANDTFLFRDACEPGSCPLDPISDASTGASRVIKTNGAVQKVELKGLNIIALAKGARQKVRVSFGTEPGDLSDFPINRYPWLLLFGTSFTDKRGGSNLTGSCPDPQGASHPNSKDPCATMRLAVSSSGQVFSADKSIPCGGTFSHPCGRAGGGFYSDGTFRAGDYGAVSLTGGGSTFPQPVQRVDLADVYFSAMDEAHTTLNSVIAAMSTRTEPRFGVEELFYSVSKEFDGNFWVYFIASSKDYVADKTGVALTSIVSKKPPAPEDPERYKVSYASFIAPPLKLQWNAVGDLTLKYGYVKGDCSNGSFRLDVALVEKREGKSEGYTKEVEVDAGKLRIYLGDAKDVKNRCASANLSGSLLSDTALRADCRSVLKGEGCPGDITIAESQKRYAKLYVRSISVVLDQGVSGDAKPPGDQMVKLDEAIVNDHRLTTGIPGPKYHDNGKKAMSPEGSLAVMASDSSDTQSMASSNKESKGQQVR